MANATPSSLQMAASQADELLEHPKTAPPPLGQEDTKKESGQDLASIAEPQESGAAPRSSVAAPKEHQENVPPANYFGLGRLIGNPFIQVTVSIILALFCIIYLPKTWDIFILIGITLLMLLKIF